MTTWTDIPDDLLEPNSPARSIDALALRDNPIAIAEGADGAPKVQEPAMADASVSTRAVVNGSVTAAKMATGGNETNWVAGRTAGVAAGAVGAYALLKSTIAGSTGDPGKVSAGSQLTYSDATGATTSAPAGTWRLMGNAPTLGSSVSLWLRIS